MYQLTQITNTSSTVSNSLSRAPLRTGFLLIALALTLAWFALSPTARAVTPPPDGGYPRNTAEGEDALFSLTTASKHGHGLTRSMAKHRQRHPAPVWLPLQPPPHNNTAAVLCAD